MHTNLVVWLAVHAHQVDDYSVVANRSVSEQVDVRFELLWGPGVQFIEDLLKWCENFRATEVCIKVCNTGQSLLKRLVIVEHRLREHSLVLRPVAHDVEPTTIRQ